MNSELAKKLILDTYRRNPSGFLRVLDLKIEKVRSDYVMAHCPFHEDSDPSFSISRLHAGWTCFSGCGSGDIFKLIAKRHGLNDRTDFKRVLEIGINIGRAI